MHYAHCIFYNISLWTKQWKLVSESEESESKIHLWHASGSLRFLSCLAFVRVIPLCLFIYFSQIFYTSFLITFFSHRWHDRVCHTLFLSLFIIFISGPKFARVSYNVYWIPRHAQESRFYFTILCFALNSKSCPRGTINTGAL